VYTLKNVKLINHKLQIVMIVLQITIIKENHIHASLQTIQIILKII